MEKGMWEEVPIHRARLIGVDRLVMAALSLTKAGYEMYTPRIGELPKRTFAVREEAVEVAGESQHIIEWRD